MKPMPELRMPIPRQTFVDFEPVSEVRPSIVTTGARSLSGLSQPAAKGMMMPTAPLPGHRLYLDMQAAVGNQMMDATKRHMSVVGRNVLMEQGSIINRLVSDQEH
jgi:hypothetical protein